MFVGTLGYDNPSTGTVTGWLRPNFDEPAPGPPKPKWSRPITASPVTAAVNAEGEPKSGTPVLDTIKANQEWVFSGWSGFEPLTTSGVKSDVWFKDELPATHGPACSPMVAPAA